MHKACTQAVRLLAADLELQTQGNERLYITPCASSHQDDSQTWHVSWSREVRLPFRGLLLCSLVRGCCRYLPFQLGLQHSEWIDSLVLLAQAPVLHLVQILAKFGVLRQLH